jgi:hypothetical protein
LIECGKLLQRGGYEIKVLNTIDLKKSMHYNPFVYIRSEKDILKFVTALIANTKGEGKPQSQSENYIFYNLLKKGKHMNVYIIKKQDGSLIDVVALSEPNTEAEAAINSLAYPDAQISKAPVTLIDSCDYIEVIERLYDETYGTGNIYPVDKPNTFNCLMWQDRFNLKGNRKYTEVVNSFENNNRKSNLAHVSPPHKLTEHLDYWLQDYNADTLKSDCNTQVFCLTDDELSHLLYKGFPADRILVKLTDYSD